MGQARSSDVWIGVALLALLLWWLLRGSSSSGRIPSGSGEDEFFLANPTEPPPLGDGGGGEFPTSSGTDDFPEPPFPPGPPAPGAPEPAPGGVSAASDPHPGLPLPPGPSPARFPGATTTSSLPTPPGASRGPPGAPRAPNPPSPPPSGPPAPASRRDGRPAPQPEPVLTVPHPGLPEPPPLVAPTSSSTTTIVPTARPSPATSPRPDLSRSPFARRDRITPEPFEVVVVDVAPNPSHRPNLDPAPPSRFRDAAADAAVLTLGGLLAAPVAAVAGRAAVAATARAASNVATRAAAPAAAAGGGGTRVAQTAANLEREAARVLTHPNVARVGLVTTLAGGIGLVQQHEETGLTSSERRVARHRPLVDFLAPLRDAVADATRRAADAPAPEAATPTAEGPELPVPEPDTVGLPLVLEDKPK